MVIAPTLQGREDACIEPLKRVEPIVVARRLEREHPQIVAAVLVHLAPEFAAEVLKNLSGPMRNDVVLRIATLQAIQPSALNDMNEAMLSLFAVPGPDSQKLPGGVAIAAKITRLMGADIETMVIESVSNYDPDLARKMVARFSGGGNAVA